MVKSVLARKMYTRVEQKKASNKTKVEELFTFTGIALLSSTLHNIKKIG